jgi:hypothetical protein
MPALFVRARCACLHQNIHCSTAGTLFRADQDPCDLTYTLDPCRQALTPIILLIAFTPEILTDLHCH